MEGEEPKVQDIAAYLERVGATPESDLAELHLRHATTVTFENLDPVCGTPNLLDDRALEDKLVHRRRGGYCFEQNLLFASALEAIGLTVTPVLARVRVGGNGTPRPRTHLLLKVTADGATWHADVGFGFDGLLAPIPWGAGSSSVQYGWEYRVVEDGGELVLQLRDGDHFVDLYGFVDEPAIRPDIEVANWYVSSHPSSPFVTRLFIAKVDTASRTMLLEGEEGCVLTTKTPTARSDTPLGYEEAAASVRSRFSLPDIHHTTTGWRIRDGVPPSPAPR